MLCGRLVKKDDAVPSPSHFFPMGSDTTDNGSTGGWSVPSITGTPSTGSTWRKDATGSTTTGSWYTQTSDWIADWSGPGISFAYCIAHQATVDRGIDGVAAGGWGTSSVFSRCVFQLAADDWAADDNVVVPNFTLFSADVYDRVDSRGTAVIYASARASGGITLGHVYHLCGTFNSTTGEASLYVNGTLADTDTMTSGELSAFMVHEGVDLTDTDRTGRGGHTIGRRFHDGIFTASDCDVQDIKVWEGTVLTPSQVAAEADLYNLGAP